MNHRHIKLDLNAKITELAVSVQIEDWVPYAEVEFRNISPKTLTEIRFIARGFGADGEVLPIEDKDRFVLVMQDLSVPAFGRAEGLRARLPREEIRQIELGLLEYSFSDGIREKYEGADWLEYDIDEFDPEDEKEALLLEALKERYPGAVCRPVQLENGWVCLCGTYNADGGMANGSIADNIIADGTIRCAHCGAEKEEAFFLTEESRLEELAEEQRRKKDAPKVSLHKTPVTEAWQEPPKIPNGAANRPSEMQNGTEYRWQDPMAAGAADQQTGNPDGSPESFSGLSGGAAKADEAPKMRREHKIMFAVIAAAAIAALILLLYFTSPNRALPFRSGYYGTGGYNGYGYNYGNGYGNSYGQGYGQNYGQSYGSSYGSGGYDYHDNYDDASRGGRHHG